MRFITQGWTGMLISFRRFRMSVFILTCVTAALLFRPVRSWVDQIAIKRIVDPAMHVSEVYWHRTQGVLEFRNLAWSGDGVGTNKGRTIDLHANRLWLAYDPLALVDGHATFPRAKAEKVRLEVIEEPLTSSNTPVWQQPWLEQLNRIRNYNWKEYFSPVLAEEELVQQWRSRFSSWSNRSRSIRVEAVGYVTQLSDESNPLRTNEQIDMQLQRSNELFQEYEGIITQIGNVESELAKSVKSREVAFSDQAEKCLSLNVVLIQPETTSTIANKLLGAAATEVWTGQSDYIQTVEQLIRSGIAIPKDAVGVNMKASAAANRWSIEQFTLSGVANGSAGSLSFDASGSVRAPARVPGGLKTPGLVPCMNYHFVGSTLQTHIFQVRSATDTDVLHYQINVAAVPGDTNANIPLSILCSSKGNAIEGEMTVAMPIVLAFVEREIATIDPDTKAEASANLPTEAQFRIGGTWSAPTFELIGEDASWAENFVSEAVEHSVAATLMEALTPIEEEFAASNLRLLQQLNGEYATLKESIQDDRSVIASSIDRMKKRTEEQSEVEFARTPATRMIIR